MRNLKKVLALVLALVMAMSLVTIATAADFSDNADIDYSEAVDVMVAAGIIDGVGNNSFDPNGTLTREQAAKLITYMLLGENSEKLGVEGTSFNDVAATRWSAPAIEYCVSLGIIDGAGDGNFYPAGKLTGYAFAKMLLTALGYDSQIEKFVGAGWTIPVATIGMEVGLHNGMENMFGNAEISRQEAAQMALNAIKAPLVYYPNKGNSITVGGTVVDFGSQKFEYVTTTLAKEQRISRDTLTNSKEYTVELGEKYLPKLELREDIDAFGRPSYTWTYDKKEVGTYINQLLFFKEYTTEVTGRDLYDLLGKSILDDKDYTFTVTVDGEDRYNASAGAAGVPDVFNETYMKRDNKANLGRTGNGVLTQVFVDSENKDVKIAVINTYLAKATSDYNDKKDSVSFTVYDLDGTTVNSVNYYWKSAADKDLDAYKVLTVSGEDFAVEDIKEDDIYRVTVADGAIQTLDEVDVVSAVTLDSFKLNDNVSAEGKKYDYASTARYDYEVLADWTGNNSAVNLKDKTYNLYLDQYGYLIGVDLVEGVDNFVFITGIDSRNSNLAAKNYDANAIFLDGRMETITFDNEKSDVDLTGKHPSRANTWCTYTVNNKGIYTLTEVNDYTGGTSAVGTGSGSAKIKVGQYHDTTATEINVKNVSLQGAASSSYSRVYGNDNTVYLNTEVKGIVTDDTPTYSGIINKVVSTVVGIKNASMDILTQANAEQQAEDNSKVSGLAGTEFDGKTAYGTYLLYKDNGYVVAAVTVADDSESSKNLVYAHTGSLEIESYDKNADEWTWARKVIHNGEEITITEKGDGISELKKMNRYNWYEVAYNANGEVVGVTHAVDTLNQNGTSPDGKDDEYQDDIADLSDSINNGKDIILFEESLYEGYTGRSTCPDNSNTAHTPNVAVALTTDTPKLDGSLYYVRTTDTTGVYVDDSVKVVFIQTNDNKVSTSIDSGKSALKYVIDHLNVEVDGGVDKYKYETSMIVDKGFAKVVIVRDLITAGSSGSHGNPSALTITVANGVVTVSGKTTETVDQVVEAIEDALANAGYTDPEITVAGGVITKIKAKRGNTVYDFDLAGDIADPTTTSVISLTPSTVTVPATGSVTATAAASNSGTVTDNGSVTVKDSSDAEVNDGTLTVAVSSGTVTVTAAAAAEGTYTAEIAGLAADGTTAATPATLTITVQAAASPTTYTVSFDANGGTGTVADVTEAAEDAGITLPAGTGLTKAGYTFIGWGTANTDTAATAGAAGVTYGAGTLSGNVTLYAVWEANTVGGTVACDDATVDVDSSSAATFTGKKGGETISVELTNNSGAEWAVGSTIGVTGLANASVTPTTLAAAVADSSTTTVTIEMPPQADITEAMANGQTITITITAP